MSTPKSQPILSDHDDDDDELTRLLASAADRQRLAEEQRLRDEQAREGEEEKIKQLRMRKDEKRKAEELRRKDAALIKAVEEEKSRKEEQAKRQGRKEEEVTVERERKKERQKLAKKGEVGRKKRTRGEEGGDGVMVDVEETGRMKRTKTGDSEMTVAGSSRKKGEAGWRVPQPNGLYVDIPPFPPWYYPDPNRSNGSLYDPVTSEPLEGGVVFDAGVELQPQSKRHIRGAKVLAGNPKKMGGDKKCGTCVQAGEETRSPCLGCAKKKKRCEPATTDDVPSLPVGGGRTEYQAEKLALLRRIADGVESLEDVIAEVRHLLRGYVLLPTGTVHKQKDLAEQDKQEDEKEDEDQEEGEKEEDEAGEEVQEEDEEEEDDQEEGEEDDAGEESSEDERQ